VTYEPHPFLALEVFIFEAHHLHLFTPPHSLSPYLLNIQIICTYANTNIYVGNSSIVPIGDVATNTSRAHCAGTSVSVHCTLAQASTVVKHHAKRLEYADISLQSLAASGRSINPPYTAEAALPRNHTISFGQTSATEQVMVSKSFVSIGGSIRRINAYTGCWCCWILHLRL